MFVVTAMVVSMRNRILFGERGLYVGVHFSTLSHLSLSLALHEFSLLTSRHFIPWKKISDPRAVIGPCNEETRKTLLKITINLYDQNTTIFYSGQFYNLVEQFVSRLDVFIYRGVL